MDIPTIAYNRFYEVFLNHIWEHHLSEKQKKILGEPDYRVWKECKEGTDKPIIHAVLPRHDHIYYNYFYQRLSEFDPNNRQYGYINDALIFDALKELNFEIPKKIKNQSLLTPRVKAHILLQLFLEEHQAELLIQSDSLIIFDWQTGKVRNIEKLVKRKQTSALKKNERTEIIMNNEQHKIEEIIRRFYNNISKPDLRAAWELIAPLTQKLRWGTFEQFELGYTNTEGIDHLHVWDIQIGEVIANCKVFYEDHVNIRTGEELGNLDILKVSQLETFNSRVNSLKSKAQAIDFKNFEDIEIYKLFDLTVSEYIWYKNNMDPAAVAAIFPSQKSYKVPRLIHVALTKHENMWLLKNFTPVRTHQIT